MSTQIAPSQQSAGRGMLFDFDGTLGVTLPSWTSAFGAAMQAHGIDATEEEVIQHCFHKPTADLIKKHGIEDGERFKQQVWSTVVEHMNHVDYYPRIPETLDALRDAGFKMAIVTNSRRVAVEPVLQRWNIHHHFDAIFTIDDVTHGKPDPEMIQQALNALNLSPSDTYIIGDSRADVGAGQRAGIRTIGFSPEENWRYMAFDVLKDLGPSHLIHSYDELWEVLGLPKNR